MRLQARLPLTMVAPGQWTTDDGSVAVVRAGRNESWVIVANGRPVTVRGLSEWPSLRLAHGVLADVREQLREARLLGRVDGEAAA